MAAAPENVFVEALKNCAVLEPAQREQLPELIAQIADPVELSQELIRRGWLTPYQASQLSANKPQDLVLDQYILLELLGQGGMGAVYKARQSRMKRLVALKVIRKEALTSRTAVERFKRESEIAAKLSHPNIVTVYDSNESNGTHFLVMEYVEGTDLAKLVKRQGPLLVERACDYIRQAALGLQHAHEQGLIHRDIKPHNLMLNQQGIVKLMDLGLARTAQAAEDEGLTVSGTVLGSPDYIAPEQAINARGVDIRADIYSLGCTFYHLLAGKVPFPTPSVAQKLVHHQLQDPPALEQRRNDIPPELGAVVRRMMEKKPANRYRVPAEVAAALEPFAGPSRTGPTSGSGSVPALPASTTIDALATTKFAQIPVVVQGDQAASPPSWDLRRWLGLTGAVLLLVLVLTWLLILK
jgi:serine/threonine protein kinase